MRARAGARGRRCGLVARRADRCEKLAEELAKKYGVRAIGIGADVAIEADIDRVVETARAKLGDVDILINNAGVSPTGRAENFKRELWDNAMAVNLTAPMLLSQRVARRLIETKKPGRIINMVSIYAGVASSVYRLSAYCATKAGLANLTRQLAVEWAPLQHPRQCDRARMDPDRSHRRWHREGRQQRADGNLHAAGTPRSAGRTARRGDFPRESGFKLTSPAPCSPSMAAISRGEPFGDPRNPQFSRGAGARMDDRGKLRRQLFRRKPAATLMSDAETHAGGLKRALGALDLTLLGIGAIVGAGIFVMTGVGARQAGPGLILSFVLAGTACTMAALCYAEFAAMIPVAGSAYSYSYATMGELVAWIIGWDLVLEYAVGAAAVAVGWSGYFRVILEGLGIHLPVAFTHAPGACLARSSICPRSSSSCSSPRSSM